jgi:glycosyltransferase involved in cell wall biosynthesis
MVFYDVQEFGGLEEYAVNLAIGLQEQGHSVSIFSAAWAPTDNQYVRRSRENDVLFIQPPRWISEPASDWATKERILSVFVGLFRPLTFLLGVGVFIIKRRSWGSSQTSAQNWLQGQLMNRIIGPDRRKALARLLLNWWRFRWSPDLFHIHGYTTNLLFAIDWAHAKDIPVVYEEHQTPDAQFDWWKDFQQSINKADRVIAVSQKSAQALHDVCGVTQPIIVRQPLLSDPLASGWKRNNLRQSGEDSLVITTIARLYVTKGLNYLLKAAALVKATHPRAQFRVYGDGELREELLAYADQLGLDGEQIFVGAFTSREELSRIMAETDIFLLSSVLEGQPLVLVEAMAYGCPIVATSVGGIPELIHDGLNGFLCNPADPECLAQKIRQLINDPELRSRLTQAARLSYEQSPFQRRAVSDFFISLYDDVLRHRKEFVVVNPSNS